MEDTVHLSDPRSPVRIEYSKGAMELIRQRAREGLMAAPRFGMGVGGLLLGVRENGRIRLLDSVAIPCSHSAGPSFNLNADEMRESQKLVAEASTPAISGKADVIGWYCSKTRGDAILSESDLAFYAELFPGTSHLALVLRPSIAEPMRAAFFFRDKNGSVVKGVECDVDEWLSPLNARWTTAPPESEDAIDSPARDEIAAAPVPDAVKSAELPVELPKPAALTPVALKPEPPKISEIIQPALNVAAASRSAETRLADIIELSDAVTVEKSIPVKPATPSPHRPDVFPAPDFVTLQRPRASKLRLGLLSAAGILVLGGTAFLTQDVWMPKPALTLTSTELDGSLVIHWNPEALRGIDHGSMFVNDGGQAVPSVIPLDRFQLKAGLLSYTPKSKRVTAKLDAGESSAVIAWFAPVTPASATPATAAPAPEPAATPPAPVPDSHKKSAKTRK
jgi:hypothetical protein